EIAMTSPVEVSSSETMMFFLPSKYDIKSAPVPTHKDVSLVTVPARTVAAIRYSGFNKDSDKKQYTNKLLKALRDNNIELDGEPSYMGYDSPFTLPWNKRHEIIVPVDILKSSTN
ncbi:MAG: heme-binding protein, partial [Pseudomonadota bacterium]|nr:heme-binding protein [Pseudomonadota bacterium]